MTILGVDFAISTVVFLALAVALLLWMSFYYGWRGAGVVFARAPGGAAAPAGAGWKAYMPGPYILGGLALLLVAVLLWALTPARTTASAAAAGRTVVQRIKDGLAWLRDTAVEWRDYFGLDSLWQWLLAVLILVLVVWLFIRFVRWTFADGAGRVAGVALGALAALFVLSAPWGEWKRDFVASWNTPVPRYVVVSPRAPDPYTRCEGRWRTVRLNSSGWTDLQNPDGECTVDIRQADGDPTCVYMKQASTGRQYGPFCPDPDKKEVVLPKNIGEMKTKSGTLEVSVRMKRPD